MDELHLSDVGRLRSISWVKGKRTNTFMIGIQVYQPLFNLVAI
jgi:hypothetical protein